MQLVKRAVAFPCYFHQLSILSRFHPHGRLDAELCRSNAACYLQSGVLVHFYLGLLVHHDHAKRSQPSS